MALHKITWEFEATPGSTNTSGSKAGWSESWYDSDDSETDVALARAKRVIVGRRSLLTRGWSLTQVRVSPWDAAIGLSRRGRHEFIAPADAVGSYPAGDAGFFDEQPYDALVFACNTALNHPHSRDLRGCSSLIINAGGRYLGGAVFDPAFRLFFKFLSGAADPLYPAAWGAPVHYGFRIQIPGGRVPVTGLVTAPLAGVAPTAGASAVAPVLITVRDLSAIAGTTILIAGIIGPAGINGTWIASAPTEEVGGVWYTPLRQKRGRTIRGTYQLGGSARATNYTIDGLTSATPGYGNSRKTGRPFNLPRGRRSAAR